jgi:hypothetical protein
MGITKFRITCRRANRAHIGFDCTYFDSINTTHYTLFKDGVVKQRSALPEELDARYVVSHNLPLRQKVGNDIFLYQDFEILDNDDYEQAPRAIKEISKRNRELYDFLMQGHSDFYIPDDKGENLNPNITESPRFTLENITQTILRDERKNKLLGEALLALRQLDEGDAESFLEVCYALRVPVKENFAKELLYNMCTMKVNANPEHFMSIINSKDRQLIALVERAINTEVTNNDGSRSTALVKRHDGLIFYNELPIADNEQEAVEYFKINDHERRALETRLGVRNAFVKPVKLVKASEIDAKNLRTPVEKLQQVENLEIEAEMMKMRKEVDRVFKYFKTPEVVQKKINALRERYMDYEHSFDAYVVKKNAEVHDMGEDAHVAFG